MDLKLKDNALLSIDNMINIDYILASGQCNMPLLTLATGNNYYIIDLDIEVVSNTTEGAYVFQANLNSGSVYNYLKCTSTNANTFNWAWATRNSAGNNISFTGRCKIRIKRSSVSNSSITINGTSTTSTFSYGGDNYTHPLYLLPSDGITMKIWSIQIYKVSSSSTIPSSSNIIANFVPRVSYNSEHYGEAALYDTISNTFKYSSSTGSFTAPTNIYAKMITAYIKDCPNVSGIDLLRKAVNLQRIRCDIGNVSGSVAELLRYTALAGFTDDYQEQQIPRIVGTFTLNNWYTNEELENFQGAIDGLTVLGDSIHNVETALENGDFAVQTLDENKPEYNQPIAEILLSNNLAHSLASDDTKIFMAKTEAAVITSLPVTLFRGNTDIESFDEFKYWTGLTTITAGSSTSATGAFGGCTALESITIPNTITTIGAYAFYNCSALEDIVIPSTVTTIGKGSFYNTTALKNIEFPIGISLEIFKINSNNNSMGCYQGNMIVHGNLTSNNYASGYAGLLFNNVIIHGSLNLSGNSGNLKKIGGTANFYIKDILHLVTNYTTSSMFTGARNFLSVGGDITVSGADSRLTVSAITNVHLGYNSVITATPTQMNINSLTNIYVGDGSSRSNDEAVLALYLADANWGSYSAKLATWYDYNGEYKWYYITDNLTNCTNTNPDAWPHITRGESYETTIVPDEGMTIDSLTVEMLDTDTTSPTYDTYIPQPTSYDSATGIYTISIPSVTGNVVITASAS